MAFDSHASRGAAGPRSERTEVPALELGLAGTYLDSLLTCAPACVAVVRGRELRFALVNPRYQAIRPDVPMLGLTYRDVFPEAADAGAEARLQAVLDTGEPWAVERYHAPIAGKPDATWEGQVVRLPQAEGAPPAALIILSDVTDQRRMEEALRESEDHYRHAVELNPQVPWTADADGNIVDLSPRWLDLTGQTREEALGSGWTRVPHPADLPAVTAAWTRAVRTGGPYDVEHRIRLADGTYRWMRARASARRDEHGRVVCWYGTTEDVHDRKVAEGHPRAILESISDGFFALDHDWRFTYVNRQAERVFDRRAGDLLGKAIWTEFPGLGGSEFERAYRRAASARAAASATAFYPDHDRWYEVNAYPAADAGISVYFRDVTERHRADSLVAAQNRALELVAGPAPLDEALAALTRIVEEQSGGQAVASILLLDDDGCSLRTGAAPGLPPEYNAALDGIKAAAGLGTCCDAAARDEVVVTPDLAAAPSWAGLAHLPLALGLKAAWSMPIRASDGRVLGTFGTYFRECREPTARERQVVEGLSRAAALAIERRRAEAALRQNDRKLRVALSAAELGAWTYCFADGRWELDERAQELYQTGGPVVIHDEAMMRRVMHADDVPHMWECVRQAADPAGEGRYRCEYRIRQPDGSYRWLAAWAHVEFEGEGPQRRAVRMIGSSRDVTAARTAEEQLRHAKDEAERASEAKSAFLATLSHELRTPLTPVLLTVSLVESRPDLPDDLREDIATIRRNVELESRLISDLLDLTRITRGKLVLDRQEIDLHLIVRSAVDICQREASAKVTVELGAAGHTVRGDGTRLQQVFWNLINNAIKFTPPDGAITVRSRDAGDGRVRVEVRDTGAGIDPAVLPRLFNAFEQGEVRATRQQAGLGLGLAISKRLAEAHGGTIVAASAGRGRGATFTVELPAIEATPLPASQPPAAGVPMPAEPLAVLLVEDHEPTLAVLTRLLRSLGHRVTGATSVASAAAAVRQDGFDVVISDLGLPDGSGLDLMRQIRERYAGRAVALTGYGMESDVAASRAAGFAEHLTKPVDLASLNTAIRRVAGANTDVRPEP